MPRDSEQLFADLVKKGDSIMNCIDMMEIPELRETLNLRAGEEGLMHPIRWIYFADCLQCVKSEYRMESYIHGSEFVVLTNRDLTDDSLKLKELIAKMQEYDIAAVGINEGQISEELVQYCDEHRLPLFELPMRFPLVDLSQIICKRLVLEENNKNAEEQLFTSILDAEHLNKEDVFAQARYLNVDLSGEFRVIEFAFFKERDKDDSFTIGQAIRGIIRTEFSHYLPQNILTQLQAGTVLALVPAYDVSDKLLKKILAKITQLTEKDCATRLVVGVGNSTGYLEDVRVSRNEAATAIKLANMSGREESVFFYKDQGIYTMISKITDSRFLDEFVEKNIGKLLRADEVNQGNLCETLEKYINHNCNAKDTAEAMYIHRNTLNYRLRKIQEILGRQINDIDTCLLLKLAFMIRNYRNMQR
jgi:sugar diacid utilization regulator